MSLQVWWQVSSTSLAQSVQNNARSSEDDVPRMQRDPHREETDDIRNPKDHIRRRRILLHRPVHERL